MDIVTCETEKSKKKCRTNVIKNNPRSQLTAPGISHIQLYRFLSNSIVFWTHLKNCFFSLHHDPVFWTHPKNQLTYLNFNS